MAGWSTPKNFATIKVNNTPSLVFGSQETCFIDSIRVTNRVNSNIFVSFFLQKENESLVAVDYYILNSVPLTAKGTVVFLKGDLLITMPGDLINANSDSSSNLFDCIVSYRELTQPTS